MRILNHTRIIVVLVSLLWASAATAEKQAILVLDASGSMWGQIDGKAKISIAREVIAGMVADWDVNNQLGLVAYGHRKKGDCADIETVLPVGKLDSSAFNQAVGGLNPIGKTPMTAAVKQAAEQLKYTEDEATVILVSDGKETCDADPCAIAAELEAKGVDFTAHVIGFDIEEEEGVAQLQCIAQQTGGEFLPAKDASGLKKALATAVAKVEEKPAVDPTAPVNLKLQAVLAEGGEPVKGNDFRVYREEADDFGEKKRVQVARDYYRQEVSFSLPPGDYIGVSYLGNAVAEAPITIEPGKPLAQQLVYNAGRVKLKAALSEGSEPVKGNDIRLYREVPDEFGTPKREQAARDYYKAEVNFIVPAGEYIAVSYLGSAIAEKKINVEAGKGLSDLLNYNAGRVKMNAVLATGKEPVSGNDFRVFAEKADEFGKKEREQIARDYYKQEVIFVIPAGDYVAASYLGNAYGEHAFSVEPGKGTAQTVVYNAGRLKLTASLEEGGSPVGGNDFRVYREEKDDFGASKQVQVARDYYKQEVVFTLPAGDYTVESINKQRRGSGTVTIPAGGGAQVQIVLNQ